MLTLSARLRYAIGDLGFNLLWQSVSLYLLYYYTDVLGIAVEHAALLYTIGTVWDGVADVAVGIALDRASHRRGRLRPLLGVGAFPLAAAFIAMYAAPLAAGGQRTAVLLIAQLAFRSCYAVANVPYLALSARITQNSQDRASIAGLRMGFGTLAAAAVGFGTVPLGRLLSGPAAEAHGFLTVAVLFAAAAVALLPLAASVPELPVVAASLRPVVFVAGLRRGLAGNTALLWLNVAMVAAIVAMTVTAKLTLYYFKYALHDSGAGQHALGLMALLGGAGLPGWVWLGRRWGGRRAWLLACALGLAASGAYAAVGGNSNLAAMLYLSVTQMAFVGLNFAFWSLLPDTIEYGERATGLRIEGTVVGVAALVQKLAIAAATALLGLALGGIGYHANVPQDATTLVAMRAVLLGIPAAALIVSAAAMGANPLRRGTHERIVAQLAA